MVTVPTIQTLARRVETTPFWAGTTPTMIDIAADALPLDEAVRLLRLAYCALLGHADRRSDVEVPDLDETISALAALPDDDEYRRLRHMADLVDRRLADARELVHG